MRPSISFRWKQSPTLAGTLAVLRLLPRVSRTKALLLALGVLLGTAFPLGVTIDTGVLIGSVPAAVRGGLDSPAGHETLSLLAVAGALIILGRLLAPFLTALAATFGRRVDRHLQQRVMAAVGAPSGVAHLEDPTVLDLIKNAQGIGGERLRPGAAVGALASLLPSWFQALGSALILVAFHWWLALLWIALWPIVTYYFQREYLRVGAVAEGQAGAVRRADYFRDLALTPDAAKEVRLWGMLDWLTARFDGAWQRAMRPMWAARNPGRPVLWLSTALVAAVNMASLGLLVWSASHGQIGLGALAVYTQAILGANSFRAFDNVNADLAYAAVSVPSLLALERRLVRTTADRGLRLRRHGRNTPTAVGSTGRISPDGLLANHDPLEIHGSRMAAAQEGRAMVEPIAGGVIPAMAPQCQVLPDRSRRRATIRPQWEATPLAPRHEIRFDHVTFRYPGRPTGALSGLDLTIRAGRSLAIVGENGAGKTTLVKLLCRLYEPTTGRVSVDGVDLLDLDARAWQRRCAAIFQDFARYHLPARDNVALGAPELAGDVERLRAAARRAGALDLIESLPRGWDTVLSRQYTDGVDLSGGEWQRVALARALFAVEAGARVLILDEPTAALDVRAEAELYDRFLEITAGLTTILISHRFSTVRRADAICVLADGRVVEQGTHDELMARGGRYAELFTLQAARFADGAGEPEEVG